MNLLFFDIDGTLVGKDPNKTFPQSAKDALKKARQAGNKLFINTGRAFCNIDEYISQVGFDGYVCGCGTQVVLDGETLFHKTLSHADSVKIAHMVRQCNADAIYERADRLFFDTARQDGENFQRIRKIYADAGLDVSFTPYDEDFAFDKFFGWHTAQSDMSTLVPFLKKYFHVMDTGRGYYEVSPIGCSKASGISFLKNYFNVPMDHIYAFGDSANDISMFDYCQNTICMGDTPDTYLKDMASYITDGVMDNGIANALIALNLIS